MNMARHAGTLLIRSSSSYLLRAVTTDMPQQSRSRPILPASLPALHTRAGPRHILVSLTPRHGLKSALTHSLATNASCTAPGSGNCQVTT